MTAADCRVPKVMIDKMEMTVVKTDSIAQLSAQIDRIEKENRRLKLLYLLGFLALPITLLVMGGATNQNRVFDNLEARRFTLKGKDGNVALLLETDNAGLPSMKMLDGKGQVRIRMGVEEELGARQVFSDKNGKARVDLSVSELGASAFQFLNDEGGPQVMLAASPMEPAESKMVFGDSKSKTRMTLGVIDGVPSISMADEHDVDRVSLKLSEDEAELQFQDPKKIPRMVITGEKDGEVFLRFHDELGKPSLVLPGGADAKE